MSWNIKVLLRPSLLKILMTAEKLMIILRVRVMMMGINTFQLSHHAKFLDFGNYFVASKYVFMAPF